MPRRARQRAERDLLTNASFEQSSARGWGGVRRRVGRGQHRHTSIAYRRSGSGIRVVRYYVEATKGARVTVTCSKRACRKTVTKGKGAKRVRITRAVQLAG